MITVINKSDYSNLAATYDEQQVTAVINRSNYLNLAVGMC